MPAELVTIAKKSFTKEEQTLLNELTKPDAKIEVIVPAEIDPKEWKSITSVVSRAYARAQLTEQKLFPVLGRLLVVAEKTAEIWNTYDSFKHFLEGEMSVKLGISVSSCYEAMQAAKRFGYLSIEQVEVIPRRNMRILLQAVAKTEEKKGYAKALVSKAAELSEKAFRDYCEKQKYIEHGDTIGAFLRIPSNQRQKRYIEKFMENPRYIAFCQVKDGTELLVRAIEEATTEWDAQITDQESSGTTEAQSA